MPTNAETYYAENAAAMKPVRDAVPDLVAGFKGLHGAAFAADSLDVKTKELIAVAIGLHIKCENCIYAHVKAAVKHGATRDEVLSASGVAVLMGGGPVYTYLPRIIEALDALDA
ncbi:MAG: carboxymuconolactone decarboxylase family protein [Planctomycetota bacterium]